MLWVQFSCKLKDLSLGLTVGDQYNLQIEGYVLNQKLQIS